MVSINPIRMVLLTTLAAVILSGQTAAEGILKVEGGRVVDAAGEPVTLRGVNLGNWLVLEMWMLDEVEEQIHDQHTMLETLAERFGAEGAADLMEVYRENWITERDLDLIPTFKMNLVRLPFEYGIIMDEGEPFEIREGGWRWLDKAIALAKRHGLYVILDLHGAPGRQSGMDHTGRSDYNKLWENEEFQEQTIWLWRRIAERYRDEETVAAYDLLNEPWGSSEDDLAALVGRLYDAVREVDSNHIVVMPGFHSGIDFYGHPDEHDWQNVLFTMHFYPGFFGWGRPNVETHVRFLRQDVPQWAERMEALGVPLLIGEFNVVMNAAGGGEMMRRHFDAYAEHGWPATMWSYKVLSKEGGIGEGTWGMVTNAAPLPQISFRSSSREEIQAFFRSFSTMKYAVHEDLREWMNSPEAPPELPPLAPPPPTVTVPGATDELPEPWQAADVGADTIAGGQRIAGSDAWTVWAGGDDIWADSDEFRYIYRKSEGDFTLSATVRDLEFIHTYSKAGLMIRSSLEADAPHALLNVFPSGNIEAATRMEAGAHTEASSGPSLNFPAVNLALQREGETLRMLYYDATGGWTLLREMPDPFKGAPALVGIATLSHDNSQLAKAEYDNIVFADTALNLAGPASLVEVETEAASQIDQTSTGGSSDAAERIVYDRTIEFAGYDWSVKAFDVQVGPGGNYFSDRPEDIWVDEEGLHLTVTPRDGRWWCTEVILPQSFGYGTYVWQTDSRVDLVDPNLVIGFFTWDNYGDGIGRWPYRELDVEFARWGEFGTELNSQFTVQPWDGGGTTHRFHTELTDENMEVTTWFEWLPDRVNFGAAYGHHVPPDVPEEAVYQRWSYSGQWLQPPGRENPRINIWMFQGKPPSDGRRHELVVSDFKFVPPSP